MAKKTKIELFEELAQIDENGYSRWVSVDEFVGEYQGLQLLNGDRSWHNTAVLFRYIRIPRTGGMG